MIINDGLNINYYFIDFAKFSITLLYNLNKVTVGSSFIDALARDSIELYTESV